MSDMRLIDGKISTTWCQRQLVKANTSFNTFLLPESPSISRNHQKLSMVRHLELEDDMKEYWGFYLLKGSSVKVSTCVRWPGASLIVIRGHKHLHECAYIGDNSSEEPAEMLKYLNMQKTTKKTKEKNASAPANQPDKMKRHRSDVEFHHPIHSNKSKNHTIDKLIENDSSETDNLKVILQNLQIKTEKNKKHQHRNSTIDPAENRFIEIQSPKRNDRIDKGRNTTSQEILADILEKLEGLGDRRGTVLEKINRKYEKNTSDPLNIGRFYSKPKVRYNDNIDLARRRKRELILSTAADVLHEDEEDENLAKEEGFVPDGIADHRGSINETTANDMSNSEFWSSFSSSEEALLNCAGLILNLPLTPHHKCSKDLTETEAEETYLMNTVTYKIPLNGYYFFVFNSENEVQTNYIRVNFDIEKAVYNLSSTLATCSNNSRTCAIDLKFFSTEKVVMELPVSDNESLWNEEFVVVSECEPRSVLYTICVIAVPVLVILFAFT